MRHFDAHPYRTEDPEGVWDFALGCMRSYLILADKARRFHHDAEIQAALLDARAHLLAEPTSPEGWSAEAIDALRRGPHHVDALAAVGYRHEHLDQLVTELLLG